jgi:hypothetical protein
LTRAEGRLRFDGRALYDLRFYEGTNLVLVLVALPGPEGVGPRARRTSPAFALSDAAATPDDTA